MSISNDNEHCNPSITELLDRVTAERDAALEIVENLRHWRDLALQFDNHRLKTLWHLKTLVSDGAHYDAAAAFLAEPPMPASYLQQRLTAADERVDVLEVLLRLLAELPGVRTSGMWERVVAALKAAEGGGDCPHGYSGILECPEYGDPYQ